MYAGKLRGLTEIEDRAERERANHQQPAPQRYQQKIGKGANITRWTKITPELSIW